MPAWVRSKIRTLSFPLKLLILSVLQNISTCFRKNLIDNNLIMGHEWLHLRGHSEAVLCHH